MAGMLDLSNLWGGSGGIAPNGVPIASAGPTGAGFDPTGAGYDPTGAGAAPPATLGGGLNITNPAQILARLKPANSNMPQAGGLGDVGSMAQSAVAGAGALPDVRGMDKGSAFATGLSSGINASNRAAAAMQERRDAQTQQDFANQMKLWDASQTAGQNKASNARADAELALRQGQDARSGAQQPYITNPDGTMALKPGAAEAIAAKTAAEATDAAPKFQVIGEDQYGNKKYGYPPKPGDAAGSSDTPAANDPVAANPDLHGADFLATLDKATASQTQAIIDGRAPYPSATQLKTPAGRQQAALVTQADPTFEAGNASARVKMQNDLLGNGPLAKTNNAINTALGHLGTLSDQGEAIGNWGSPIANAPANFLNRTVGGSNTVSNFNSTLATLGPELVKSYRGSGGAEADVKRFIDSLDPNGSPDQIRGAIANIATLLHSKITANEEQVRQTMGPLANIPPLLADHSKDQVDKIYKRDGYQNVPDGYQRPDDQQPAQSGAPAALTGQPNAAIENPTGPTVAGGPNNPLGGNTRADVNARIAARRDPGRPLDAPAPQPATGTAAPPSAPVPAFTYIPGKGFQ